MSRSCFYVSIPLGLALTASIAHAQSVSSQDKHFLEDTAQDSNYEIKTSQLALEKSNSADVKQYARMVMHDHEELNKQIAATDHAVQVTPPDAGSMSINDHASLLKLQALKGDSFDQSYIKGLVDGNVDSIKQAQNEVAATSVPSVKTLAQHRLQLDQKHAKAADQLAQAHHVKAS